jgi:hypothetical protein
MGVPGSVVIKAVCYKLEGRMFETRWCESIFSAALGPGVYSACDNEYQKSDVPGE